MFFPSLLPWLTPFSLALQPLLVNCSDLKLLFDPFVWIFTLYSFSFPFLLSQFRRSGRTRFLNYNDWTGLVDSPLSSVRLLFLSQVSGQGKAGMSHWDHLWCHQLRDELGVARLPEMWCLNAVSVVWWWLVSVHFISGSLSLFPWRGEKSPSIHPPLYENIADILCSSKQNDHLRSQSPQRFLFLIARCWSAVS